MVKVLLYGVARIKFNQKELYFDATSVRDLLEKMAESINVSYKDMKNYLIYVNDVNITDLKMFKTPLHDNDCVMLLSPSSGG